MRRSSLLSTFGNTEESEEGWSTEEGEDDGSDNGSSSSNISQNRHTRHFPPKLSELTPGCSVPVEVSFIDLFSFNLNNYS